MSRGGANRNNRLTVATPGMPSNELTLRLSAPLQLCLKLAYLLKAYLVAYPLLQTALANAARPLEAAAARARPAALPLPAPPEAAPPLPPAPPAQATTPLAEVFSGNNLNVDFNALQIYVRRALGVTRAKAKAFVRVIADALSDFFSIHYALRVLKLPFVVTVLWQVLPANYIPCNNTIAFLLIDNFWRRVQFKNEEETKKNPLKYFTRLGTTDKVNELLGIRKGPMKHLHWLTLEHVAWIWGLGNPAMQWAAHHPNEVHAFGAHAGAFCLALGNEVTEVFKAVIRWMTAGGREEHKEHESDEGRGLLHTLHTIYNTVLDSIGVLEVASYIKRLTPIGALVKTWLRWFFWHIPGGKSTVSGIPLAVPLAVALVQVMIALRAQWMSLRQQSGVTVEEDKAAAPIVVDIPRTYLRDHKGRFTRHVRGAAAAARLPRRKRGKGNVRLRVRKVSFSKSKNTKRRSLPLHELQPPSTKITQ